MRSISRVGLLTLFVVGLDSPGFTQSVIITTYAGPAMPVNGESATNQAIDRPASVVWDGAEGFYLASQFQNRIYHVSAAGQLSIVAGNGPSGFSGDGGPATLAQLHDPSGITVDGAGNVFIADYGNNRVRKVTPNGVISTIAGNGTQGFSGDGGPAASAQLYYPWGVAVDAAGNLFIGDWGNSRVRKVTPGGVISTVAGNGAEGFSGDGGPAASAQLRHPYGVALDGAGNLLIADCGNNRVRKMTPDGVISTVAGGGTSGLGDGGPAFSAQLYYPWSVAVDAVGDLFIADSWNSRIRKVTPSGVISTVAGNGIWGFSGDGGPATSAQLFHPWGVSVDTAGHLFIADYGNNRIRKVTPDGVISTAAGNGTEGFCGDGGPATSAQVNNAQGMTVDAAGNLFIADTGNNRVRKVTPDGVISTVAGNGTWGFSGDGGPATSAQVDRPIAVAVDAAGSLFIADYGNRCVRKVMPDGVISTVVEAGTGGILSRPYSVAVDAAGNLFIADTSMREDWWHHGSFVRKVTPSGVISTVAGSGPEGFAGDGGPATSAKLYFPQGVAVDASGNLFIADTENERIRKVTPDGMISTVAGNGTWGFSGDGGPATAAQLNSPTGVAVDAAGSLFIADQHNLRIRRVTPDGVISTVAGNGAYGFSGDGGPATFARLCSPSGVAVDAAGNLFIADTGNSRIRKVTGGPSVSMDFTLSAGGATSSFTAGEGETVQAGYAALTVHSGSTPYGTAVFSFKQDGVTVSEAGVPASPPTTSARLFIEYCSSVPAVPGRTEAGTIDINTGIAVVNRGSETANVTYLLRNVLGTTLSSGHGTIAGGAHFAKFIDQMKDAAPDFDLPSDFQSTIQFGSLDISSDQPLSVLALRTTTNQRNEVLFTTTPTADLTRPLTGIPIYFPQFADGGGYTTTLVLLNISNGIETGTFRILDDTGSALVVNQVGGTADSSFKYSIAPGGAFRFQTDGFPAATKAGWVQLTPDPGTSTPVGAGMFSYNPDNVLVTESGIPAAASTTHARVYVDSSEGHNTGLAIANLASAGTNVFVRAFESDGKTGVGNTQGVLPLPARGHSAKFAGEFVAGLPEGFRGVLDIRSAMPFVALTMRSLTNERGDFLLTTFPIADMNRAAPSPLVFPQIADGGGFVTEFILLSAGGASTTTLSFLDKEGRPLAVGK